MRVQENTTVEDRKITPRSENYAQWYLDIIGAADLAENGPVKGTMIIKPLGYALWEKVQEVINREIKNLGVQNVYFPMLIPEKLLKKEESHVEGFSPEVAVVTFAGGEKLEEGLILRPTSEAIMYETFSRWVQSHRDLPLLINQWANVIRWELRPRLFLRTTEFLWQEGHTAHATSNEADAWARMILNLYKKFAEEIMAIPVIVGEKSESEKFAGALKTYSVEAMMQDGKALQFATSHNLGQNFSKAFNIEFTNENNSSDYVWQTSWGLSTRVIGGLIMTHSDDKGLVLPPNIAPILAVIIPIWNSEESKVGVIENAKKLHNELVDRFTNTAIILDDRDVRSGSKHYHWEKRGVPIRIEIGLRDIQSETVVIVRRDTSEKQTIKIGDIITSLEGLFKEIQISLFSKALNFQKSKSIEVSDWENFIKEIELGKFVTAYWCGDAEIEKKIKEETKATIRCLPLDPHEIKEGQCVYSKRPAKQKAVFARSY